MSFLKANNILSDKQFGFRGGRSTVLQLLNVVDHWSKILDNGGTVVAIYCDFQKAFDTVPHNRLNHLLTFYGLPNPILSWIEDFLTDRLQHVSVNGITSEQFHAPSGVPQGSVLGPVLFIIYINSMILKAGNANIYLYADDLKLYREIKSEDDTELLQKDLDILYDWSLYSLLKFHPGKCVVMRFEPSSNKIESNPFYGMDEIRLKVVEEEKDLGIVFDKELSFNNHISCIVKKSNSLVGMICQSFYHLDLEMFKCLFTAIVRPHLEYGAAIWNPHLKKHIIAIENVQRRATKLVPELLNLPYPERLKVLRLPTLLYRRYRGDMIEMYKITRYLRSRCYTIYLFSIKCCCR